MPQLLFITNLANRISVYTRGPIEASRRNGLAFHAAANWSSAAPGQTAADESEYGIRIHQADISRSPFSPANRKALAQVREIIKTEKIDCIHCNTPVGGVIGRLLSKNVRKVIYEAHGFHFYKGAPLMNWLLYYPVEKILAGRTDAIITINRDDYAFAQKHLRSRIYYVPGVGIELAQWQEYRDIRETLGFGVKDFVILVVGRLEKNKNCGTIIDAAAGVPGVRVVFCGDGEDRQMLEEKAAGLGIRDRVLFLGNRSDMPDVYHAADCFVMASFREGLSRSIMEAMACGLPCIVSDIRGNRDLIDEKGGFLFDPSDAEDLADKLSRIRDSEALRAAMRSHNLEKIKSFSYEKVVDELTRIYGEVFGEGKS